MWYWCIWISKWRRCEGTDSWSYLCRLLRDIANKLKKSVRYSCETKEIYLARKRTENRTGRRRDRSCKLQQIRQKYNANNINIMHPVQHRLRMHKNWNVVITYKLTILVQQQGYFLVDHPALQHDFRWTGAVVCPVESDITAIKRSTSSALYLIYMRLRFDSFFVFCSNFSTFSFWCLSLFYTHSLFLPFYDE